MNKGWQPGGNRFANLSRNSLLGNRIMSDVASRRGFEPLLVP